MTVWVVVFSLFAVWIIYSDIRYRIISNKLVACVLVTVFLYSFQSGLLNQWLYSIPVLAIGFLLWWLGVIGAGDVKLLAVLVPAINPDFHLFTFLVVAFSGGIVAVLTLLYAKLITKKSDITVPYGVPIALGCWLGILASL